MENYLPLFSIGVLVFMFYWMLFPIRLSKVKAWCKKAWHKTKTWYKETWTKKRIVDFFCNIVTRIDEDVELY